MSQQHRTVVIAIDNSFDSEFAFDFYVENEYKEGDRIVLVHVPEYSNVLSTSSLLTDPNIVTELLKDNEDRICKLVEKYSAKMNKCHLSGHVKQQWGKPGEAIIEAAREEDASLVPEVWDLFGELLLEVSVITACIMQMCQFLFVDIDLI